MTELTITIPGKIDHSLSPNARVHWRTLAAAKGNAKDLAFAYARRDAFTVGQDDISSATYHIELGKAKGEKQKDADNLVASCKAHLDGIAAALGVDDRGWTLGTVTQVRDPDGIGYLSIRLEWEQAEGAAA